MAAVRVAVSSVPHSSPGGRRARASRSWLDATATAALPPAQPSYDMGRRGSGLLTGPSPRALAGVNGCWRASRLGPGRAAAVCGHGHGYMHADGDALMCTFAAPLQHEQPRWAPTARVHPTALVSPLATLGEHVVVGPFCTVGPEAVLGDHCELGAGVHIYGRSTLGARNVLRAGAVVGSDDPGCTVLGDGNTIGHHALVGVKCQDLKYDGGDCFLVVGNNNDIREFAQLHRSSAATLCTVLGDGNLLMGGCHVAHDCHVGHRNIMANNTLLAGHVQVGDAAVLGGGVAVCPFCAVGSYAFLAGGSMVEGDVPDGLRGKGDRATLQGVNFEGLRRNGYSAEAVSLTQRACRELFRGGAGAGGAALAERAAAMLATGEYGDMWSALLVAEHGAVDRRNLRDFGARLSPDCCPSGVHGGGGGAAVGADVGGVNVSPAERLLTSVIISRTRYRARGLCRWRGTAGSSDD